MKKINSAKLKNHRKFDRDNILKYIKKHPGMNYRPIIPVMPSLPVDQVPVDTRYKISYVKFTKNGKIEIQFIKGVQYIKGWSPKKSLNVFEMKLKNQPDSAYVKIYSAVDKAGTTKNTISVDMEPYKDIFGSFDAKNYEKKDLCFRWKKEPFKLSTPINSSNSLNINLSAEIATYETQYNIDEFILDEKAVNFKLVYDKNVKEIDNYWKNMNVDIVTDGSISIIHNGNKLNEYEINLKAEGHQIDKSNLNIGVIVENKLKLNNFYDSYEYPTYLNIDCNFLPKIPNTFNEVIHKCGSSCVLYFNVNSDSNFKGHMYYNREEYEYNKDTQQLDLVETLNKLNLPSYDVNVKYDHKYKYTLTQITNAWGSIYLNLELYTQIYPDYDIHRRAICIGGTAFQDVYEKAGEIIDSSGNVTDTYKPRAQIKDWTTKDSYAFVHTCLTHNIESYVILDSKSFTDIKNKIEEYTRYVKKNDVTIYALNGHGDIWWYDPKASEQDIKDHSDILEYDSSDEGYIILAADYGLNSDNTMKGTDYGIRYGLIKEWIDNIGKVKILLINSCHSGSAIQDTSSTNVSLRTRNKENYNNDYLNSIINAFKPEKSPVSTRIAELAQNNYFVICSTPYDKNGFGVHIQVDEYTRNICKGLGYDADVNDEHKGNACDLEADSNKDGHVSVHELFDYINKNYPNNEGKDDWTTHAVMYPENDDFNII